MLKNSYYCKVSSAPPMAGSGQPLFDVNHFHAAVIEMIGICDLVYAKKYIHD